MNKNGQGFVGASLTAATLMGLCLAMLLAGAVANAEPVKTESQFDAMRWPTRTMREILPPRLAKLDASLHAPVATLEALQAIPAADRADGMAVVVQSGADYLPHGYQFSATSTATADDDLVVPPAAGGGRWLRLDRPTTGLAGDAITLDDAQDRYPFNDLETVALLLSFWQSPILGVWDPSDVGAGAVEPPTALEGDRYIASATEDPFVQYAVYTSDGSGWVETLPETGDIGWVADTGSGSGDLWIYTGATWSGVLAQVDTRLPLSGGTLTGILTHTSDTAADEDSDDDVEVQATANGLIATTKALTTAMGSDYTVSIQHGGITATTPVVCNVAGGTNTQDVILLRAVPGAGSVAVTLRAAGTDALDGTVAVSCWVP